MCQEYYSKWRMIKNGCKMMNKSGKNRHKCKLQETNKDLNDIYFFTLLLISKN